MFNKFFKNTDSNRINKTKGRRLQFETLESREMLSASPFGIVDNNSSELLFAASVSNVVTPLLQNSTSKVLVVTAAQGEVNGTPAVLAAEILPVAASPANANAADKAFYDAIIKRGTVTDSCFSWVNGYITSLAIANKGLTGTLDVSGLTKLQYLSCTDNQLTSLNVQGLMNLQELWCYNNQLTSLNVQGCTNLQLLQCYDNHLTSLNVQGLTKIQSLGCSINQLTSLNVQGLTKMQDLRCYNNQLTSLNVQGFTNLQVLTCYGNQLTSLNVQGFTNLQTLQCGGNQLTSLNVQGCTNLKTLGCQINQLTSLEVQGLMNLQNLYCFNNQLTSLEVQGCTNLQLLWCYNNQLTSLNAQGCTNLQDLSYDNNPLTSLNVQDCTKLQDLSYYNNQLTSLNVQGCTNLQTLYCYDNQLTLLNVQGCTNLKTLHCYGNQLTSLNVKDLTKLQDLQCYDNQLTSLNVQGCINLQTLYCYGNQLTSLNTQGLTNLQHLWGYNNQLTSLNVQGCTNLQALYCYDNQLTSLNVQGLANLLLLLCYNNQLTSLNVQDCANLQILSCYSNKLTSLNVAGTSFTDYLNWDKSVDTYLGTTFWRYSTIVNNKSYRISVEVSQNYAVLFAGGVDDTNNAPRYSEALNELYTTLITKYALSPENIYVLYANAKTDSAHKVDMAQVKVNLTSATLNELNTVFDTIGKKMNKDDHLLFYTYDHGDGKWADQIATTDEVLCGWGEQIPDVLVAASLGQIQKGYITTVFAQCYSGGILDNVRDMYAGNPDVHFFGMAATNHYELAWNGGFARSFIGALNGGFNTTDAAFAFALYNDPYAYYDENYPPNGGSIHLGDDLHFRQNNTWQAMIEHPWAVGEEFAIFAPIISDSQNGNRPVNPAGSNTTSRLSNNATGLTDAPELLAADNIYLTYAVGNFGYEDGNGIYAKYSWTDTPETLDFIRQNETLEKTVSLGQLAAGTHTVTIELHDNQTNELIDTITRTFTVKPESTDPGDSTTTAKIIDFTNDQFIITETIGNGSELSKDVDLYQLNVTASDVGKTFLISSSPTNDKTRYSVWSFLRLFDGNGIEIARNEISDLYEIGDAFLSFIPSAAGTYYIGVSANNNIDYDSKMTGSGTNGNTGDYQFSIRRLEDPKPDLSLFYETSWYRPIISITTQDNSLSDNQFTANDELFLNFSFTNLGETTATNIKNRITITSTNGYSFTHDFITETLAIGNVYALPQNESLGKLEIGTYTISLELNIDNSNELTRDNNTYQTTFEVLPPLAPPQNLRPTAEAQTAIALDWNDVTDATSYILQRKEANDNNSNFVTVYTGTDSKYVDRGLTADTEYLYRVQAVGSAFSVDISAKTTAKIVNGKAVTDSPIILSAKNENGKTTIAWTDLDAGYRYLVYKDAKLVVNLINTLSYIDDAPSPTTTYSVYAFNDSLQKWSWATPVVVSTTAPAIEITGHEVLGNGAIKLQWASGGSECKYMVYQGGYPVTGILNTTEWTDTSPLSFQGDQYQIYTNYIDENSRYQWTWSNLYFIKKPTSSSSASATSASAAVSPLNTFWAEYGLQTDDELLLELI